MATAKPVEPERRSHRLTQGAAISPHKPHIAGKPRVESGSAGRTWHVRHLVGRRFVGAGTSPGSRNDVKTAAFKAVCEAELKTWPVSPASNRTWSLSKRRCRAIGATILVDPVGKLDLPRFRACRRGHLLQVLLRPTHRWWRNPRRIM